MVKSFFHIWLTSQDSNELGNLAISYHFPVYFLISTSGTVVSVFIGWEQDVKQIIKIKPVI
jgi:hypothetical protein